MADEELAAWSRMYRVVHGWPMIGGLPVPLFLGTMLVVILGGLGGSMFFGLPGVAVALAVTGLWWLGSAWVFSKDQVALPLFLLNRRAPLHLVVSSYNPSWFVVSIDDDEEGRG